MSYHKKYPIKEQIIGKYFESLQINRNENSISKIKKISKKLLKEYHIIEL